MSSGSRRLRRGLIMGVLLVAVLAGGALAFAGKHIASEQVAYSGPQAAICVPKQLNASDLLPGGEVAVSPLPGSHDASPQTQISFLGMPAGQLSGIGVSGSMTGGHAGRLEPYSQGDGASFVPEAPFHSGETVTVTGQAAGRQFSFQFEVAYPDPVPVKKETTVKPTEASEGAVQHFHSEPELEPPSIDVTTDLPGVAPGDIFLAPYSGPARTGPMIATQQGQLVWMDQLPGNMKATNLQVERYEGQPVLTWWQGYIPPQGFGEGEEIVADSSYRQILKIKAGNGDLADLHDFHLEPHNTALLTVFHTIHCDLSAVGGPRDGAVTDGLFQEIDVKTGLVRREWTSVDHVGLAESYSSSVKASPSWPFDFFHINTIDPRPDGTTLISGRNTSALYLLDTRTGQVLEKVGGRKSTIAMGEGSETAFQHDAMTLPDGDVSIFDNGGVPWTHEQSRGVIVDIDFKHHTDTLLQELDHSPALKAGSQGDVQLQPNGNYFVGWGQEPYFSEFNANGETIYDAHMPEPGKPTNSYRAYKFEWHATPYWSPVLAAQRSGSEMEVWASWNGATEVASWRLLGGGSPASLKPLASVQSSGFETALKAGYTPYVAVEALNAEGAVIGNSKTIQPGD